METAAVREEWNCTTRSLGGQLIGGNNSCSGRVELQRYYRSGTVCNYYWDLHDADVLCRQLDCGFALSSGPGAMFGKETGLTWKTNFNCLGNESRVLDCPCSHCFPNWKPVVFLHFETDHKQLRLVDDGSSCSGTVEVYRHGNWRRVRDQFWDLNDTNVVCRQMGCGPAIRAYSTAVYREGEWSPWLKDVHCQGNETNLLKCKPSSKFCSCSTEDTHIRLMDGGSSCAGRVEIYYNETWGTVCDDSWGSLEADVVCKQLGCGSAVDTISAAPCGSASGQVWLDEVRCSGKESALWECASSPWGQHDSYQSGSVISALTDESDVSGVHSHRVIKVKADNFVQEEILSRLSLLVQVALEVILIYWPIILQRIYASSHVVSSWNALQWRSLKKRGSPLVNCIENINDRSQYWSTEHKMLRLMNGQHSCEGRVEVFYNETWGTVCSDVMGIELMGLEAAEVICKQLDCGRALDVDHRRKFGEGSGPIWLDDIACNSNESFLWQCSSPPWGEHNCDHREDVGVICSGNNMLLNAHFGVNIYCVYIRNNLILNIYFMQRNLRKKRMVRNSALEAHLISIIYQVLNEK
uniref:SRCR domain-containing protein n=1 Tax=Callorhinchus milii TaxID=7868 RepID=A0A4W3HGN3_CALMI